MPEAVVIALEMVFVHIRTYVDLAHDTLEAVDHSDTDGVIRATGKLYSLLHAIEQQIACGEASITPQS